MVLSYFKLNTRMCIAMCTSIFTMTKDGKHLLSRTMDFSFPLEPNPIYLPRNYEWLSSITEKPHMNQYGFVGAGRLLGDAYFVADGVNEKGLAVAELYLPGEVYYAERASEEHTNLAPHEFILWLLGNFATIDEIEKELSTIKLVEKAAPVLNFVTPLHWIITDKSGKCVVIEPTDETLFLKDNPVGVMTNTPSLEWHIANLRNYLHVRPKQFDAVKFGEYQATAFSQGTGTSGLPGGFTPPERFVRAAFFKEYIEVAENEEDGVNNAHHILNTVRIPKGIVITADQAVDYSQYVGAMCNESGTYYYSSYDSHQIVKVRITEKLLQTIEPVVFEIAQDESIKELN